MSGVARLEHDSSSVHDCEEDRVFPLIETANGNESLPGRILFFEE